MIKRDVFKYVKDTISMNSIPIIVGHRRVGKTTLLKQLAEEYSSSIYLSMDSFTLRKLNEGEFIRLIENHIQNGIEMFLFDEIQFLDNWDLILKQLFDKWMEPKKIKIVVTGSSSLSFVNRDTGVDRTRKIVMGTLTYKEYLEISNTNDTYDNFEHYLSYGAFPKYINSNLTIEELMNFTLSQIIAEDLPIFYGFKNSGLEKMLYELSTLTNGEFNKDKSSKRLGIKASTIDGYLDALERAMIIRRVERIGHDGNIGRYPKYKIYINPHFHIWMLGKEFSQLDNIYKGHIIESYYVFTSLQGYGYYKKFNYYKHADGREIDFVTLSKDAKKQFDELIEFKYVNDISNEGFELFDIISSNMRTVWCKENKVTNFIEYKSIKDLK